MNRWIALAIAVAVLLLGYVAAGPYLAIRGIHEALRSRDLDRLERHVDFLALRGNMQAQVEDRLARAAGAGILGDGMLGGIARQVVGQISGHAVDAMVTPQGIAMLLEGRALARRATGATPRSGKDGKPEGYRPLQDARTRFESPSRFTATTRSAGGEPVVFVFERQGLRWRLTDIRLPPRAPVPGTRMMEPATEVAPPAAATSENSR